MSGKEIAIPGSKALTAMKNVHGDTFKVPKVPRRRSNVKVLDEEFYVEEIGKIIQRDFFPDLEKLKAQNDYLEAMDRNDLTKLRELYMKYSGRKPPPERVPSPATFETPANIHNSQVFESISDIQSNCDESENSKSRLSLDQFLGSYTSQDNESFEEIMDESEIKHKEKYSYLYNEETKSEEDQKTKLALPSIEEQCALPEKKLNLDYWGYKNKNYIMYIPDGVSLTAEEEIEMSRKRQEVVHGNTRLSKNPFNDIENKEKLNELAKTQAKVLDGKIGVDGKELMTTDGPVINGYSFVTTPSPCPGVTDSPLMTWGEIEGTPFRLDGSDTPIPRASGPAFKMSEPPRREQIGIALADKARKNQRKQKKRAMDAARRHFASPSPRPGTSSIDRLSTMSPAAQRLASAKLKHLRGLNSPSPALSSKTPVTPNRIVTPKLNLGIKKFNDNLTDDLLKIDVPKRQKASDFF